MHLFLGHCGLILQLAPYNWVNFGGPLPLNSGGQRGKAMGNDRSNRDLLACTYAARISLEIGELLGEKVKGLQIGPRFLPKLKE